MRQCFWRTLSSLAYQKQPTSRIPPQDAWNAFCIRIEGVKAPSALSWIAAHRVRECLKGIVTHQPFVYYIPLLGYILSTHAYFCLSSDVVSQPPSDASQCRIYPWPPGGQRCFYGIFTARCSNRQGTHGPIRTFSKMASSRKRDPAATMSLEQRL